MKGDGIEKVENPSNFMFARILWESLMSVLANSFPYTLPPWPTPSLTHSLTPLLSLPPPS